MSFDPDEARADAAAEFELEMSAKQPARRNGAAAPRRPTSRLRDINFLGPAGAAILKARIVKFWARAGYNNVEILLVPVGTFGGNQCYGLTSNLKGGLPPAKIIV
jgi:hypothetical protein